MEEMPCEDRTPTRNAKLCSAHFEDDCFHQRCSRRYLRKRSVPTKFDSPARTSERSPRKRQQAQSHVGTLQRQQRKQRHRQRQPSSSTTQPSPGEAPEASAATGRGSSAKSTLETMPEYLSVRCHEASAATGPGSSAESTPDATLEDVRVWRQASVNIVDIFTDPMRNLVLRISRKPNNMYAEDVRKFALTAATPKCSSQMGSGDRWKTRLHQGVIQQSHTRSPEGTTSTSRNKSIGMAKRSSDTVTWATASSTTTASPVFLAVAVNKSWKIPLGYALIDGLDGSIRANLARQYITKFEEAGAECISVTCDGPNCNISMLTALAVFFSPPLRGWFPNPSDLSRKVYGLLDACHMLKLMRNLLAEELCIRDGAGREKGIRGFEGVEATAEFAAAVDNIFDLSNSCHPLGRGSKVPVRAVNKDTMLTCIDQASHYLRGSKHSTCQPLSQGARKTPILGFLLVLESIKGLAEDLVWGPSPPLRCLLTGKLSQDRLELFFATVRNRTSNNDNPTALEFRSAYRKCLVASVQPSTRGNCQVDGTATLRSSGCHQQVQARDEAATGEGNHETNSYQSLSKFAECVVEYIAGNVAVNFAKVTKCPECSRIALVTSDKRGLVLAKDAGGLLSPSQDVLHLCTIAEKVLRRNFDKVAKGGRNWLLMLQTETMGIATKTPLLRRFEHLFLAQIIDHRCHCAIMMKTTLEYYFKLRIHHMCRQQSAAKKGVVLRQLLTKLVIFRGQ
ncbi:hypothetical protein HPB47_000664 [Ixodes persulcatus]|uniref:Uncharacterized protein n=1 Tax=Ixodes persulcatus TaxID=34615 RepID=A0AC60PRB7_IXOPE|nr:hypothetical protein HPB47_000664 [Ixodes persulcatus]